MNEYYEYTECGLSSIHLINGYTIADSDYGKTVSIIDLEGLHKAIGLSLVIKTGPLHGEEIRYLRLEMDLSQKRLSEMLDLTEQTVARWEKDEVTIPTTADLVIRQLYKEAIHKGGKLSSLIKRVTEEDRREAMKNLVFKEGEGWTARRSDPSPAQLQQFP